MAEERDDEYEMVVIDGVRYRPEDAKQRKAAEAKKRTPANKARTAQNKSGDSGSS